MQFKLIKQKRENKLNTEKLGEIKKEIREINLFL